MMLPRNGLVAPVYLQLVHCQNRYYRDIVKLEIYKYFLCGEVNVTEVVCMARLLIVSVLYILALYLAYREYKQGRPALVCILKFVVSVIIGVLLGMFYWSFIVR